jgi:hypothetical protein
MDQHLTVREACEHTQKSESTIKRLIREITSPPSHPDRPSILPPPEEVERRRKAGDVFVWKLNRDFLDRRFPKASPFEQGSAASRKTSSTPDDTQAIIHVLREQLHSKDRQIQTLETQLDRKDEQIKNLGDRMHESNVLMRELQSRLAIAAPAAPLDSAQQGSEVSIKTPSAKSQPQKSRSLFGRFFRAA